MSKIIILVLSVLLVLSISLSLILFKDKDYYLDLQIGKTASTPTPMLADNTSKPMEDAVISPTFSDTPIIKKNINENILIPIKDSNGTTIADIVYNLISYELKNEIIVQGKRATMVEGKEILIIMIELSNNSENTIEIDSRDYLRLSVNDGEWVAPDTHNDPIVIQPLSTKSTQLGFSVNTTDKNFSLKLGNVEEESKIITLQK